MATTLDDEADILARIIDPAEGALSLEAARFILSLKFDPADVDRMNRLSRRAADGTLAEEDQDRLDRYERIGHLLAILQSKARLALRNANADEMPLVGPQ
ncbi:MAG: hypothetical protein WD066_03775 [Planctomycetaceae bacterium]